jgi:hypothetical protein
MNLTMVVPLVVASSGTAFVIETKSSPPYVCNELIEGPVKGLYIIHSIC